MWDPLAHSVEYRSSRSRGPRIWPRPGRRRVPHVQLKSEMLRLRGAEVERRVSRIYTNKNVCAWKGERKKKKKKKKKATHALVVVLFKLCEHDISIVAVKHIWSQKKGSEERLGIVGRYTMYNSSIHCLKGQLTDEVLNYSFLYKFFDPKLLHISLSKTSFFIAQMLIFFWLLKGR